MPITTENPMRSRLRCHQMHLDLELGKRHVAVFLGSVAALIALALTPQLLGDLVAEGIAGLADVLALGSASGVLPRWPIAVLLLGTGIAAVIAWRVRDSRPGTKLGHALDVFRV